MTCAEARPLLDAYFDSELDVASALAVERHVHECAACSEDLKKLERLREELTPAVFDWAEPAELERLGELVRKMTGQRPQTRLKTRRLWTQPALWAAVAAALVLAIMLPLRHADTGPDRELVDSHVRSLLANHLVDVPSSDQHTVKPWFQGKVDFAPDVPDLRAKGYELVGGRLDVLGGRPAAALVYKHGQHFLNLWTARTEAGETAPQFSVVDGYQVVRWNVGGLSLAAVTDMNRTQLLAFIEAFRSRR